MSSIADIKSKRAAETRIVYVDFASRLDGSCERLTGTPTAVERGTAGLTISSVAISQPVTRWPYLPYLPWPYWRNTQAGSTHVKFTVAGGTAGTEYTVRVTAATTLGQSLIEDVTFIVN